jgi:hypothetical protein
MAPLSPCPSLISIQDSDDVQEFKRSSRESTTKSSRVLRQAVGHSAENRNQDGSFRRVRRRRPSPPRLLHCSASLGSFSSVESDESISSEEDSKTSSSFPLSESIVSQLPPLTFTLPLLVFMDMFAVSLVVPLLFQYFQMAGVSNAGQREFLSSIFSSAQIVGGLVLGAFMDARWVEHKTVLFLSFGGSAISYALIAHGGISALISSRVLVGLVKQTMTITKAMLTKCTNDGTRAQYMGRLSASATAAWVLGPSVGAVLFKYIDPRAPAVLASGFFLVNIFVAAVLLPGEVVDGCSKQCDEDTNPTGKQLDVQAVSTSSHKSNSLSFLANLKSCFSSNVLSCVVRSSLIITWVTRATNSNNLSNFYEELYGLQPHHRGYIASYQQIVGFFIESCVISPFLQWIGGERRATTVCALLLSVVVALQSIMSTSLPLFLGLVCPITSLAYSIMFTSLQTLATTVVPSDSMFSVLAAMDVLQNAVSVTVPFYRAMMFARLSGDINNNISVDGDPDPVAWLSACTVHWFGAAIALGFFLLWGDSQWSASVQTGFKKLQ